MFDETSLLGYFLTGVIGGVIFIFLARAFKTSKCSTENQNESRFLILEVTNRDECALACSILKKNCQDLSALGFDCEWVSYNGKQNPVALLQLACVHGVCCLFRLNLFRYVPKELEKILNDPEILKVGVSPTNDAKLLNKDYGIQVHSTLDLRHLYPCYGGLSAMAAGVINEHLDKNPMIQCSNWERYRLSNAQKNYAAKDAFVAIEIFKNWLRSNRNFSVSYPNTYIECYRHSKPELVKYLDINFKQKRISLIQNMKFEALDYQNRKRERSGYVTRKAPLYHNCFMHAPDGELLCSCDRRKAQWYVDKGLAEVLPGEPYSIRLLFEPSARASNTTGGRYYKQLKQNHCVVCGALHSYLRHHVVPQEYRKHFPNIMKDHQSHDILLMCVTCHQLATQHNEALRKQLAVTCDAPLNNNDKTSQNRTAQKVKNSAKALLVSGDTIPQERRVVLENVVKAYYKVDDLTPDLLKGAANLKSKIINQNVESHGIKVVNYYLKEYGRLTELEVLWRQYFLNTMNPHYLPALWSVNHNHSRLTANQL